MTQVVSNMSWGQRLRNAFFGVLFGVILIIGAVYYIFWNEKTGLHTAQSLSQAAQMVISVDPNNIDTNNEKKVIYFSGQATTSDILKDNLLNISVNAIRLSREVVMYQWQEKSETKTDDNLGGSQTQTTTYSYYKDWFPTVINSTSFHDAGHDNPNSMPIASANWQAQNVMVGNFRLPTQLIDEIDGKTNFDLRQIDTNALQTQFNKPVSYDGEYLYIGSSPQQPAIGDVRLRVTTVLPQMVSVIAQQTGTTLQSYVPPAGQPVALLTTGQQSSQDMILAAEKENKMTTWLIRFLTLVALIAGFAFILQPIVVLSDIVPIFGSIVGIGIFLIAFTCGLSVWLVMTAVAWFAFRPLMSAALIVIALLVLIILYKLRHRRVSNIK